MDNANNSSASATDIKTRLKHLTDAIVSGNAVLVRMLAVPGLVNLPEMQLSGQTPLMVAVGFCGNRSNIDCVKALVDAGAFLNLSDYHGDTALTIACNTYLKTRSVENIKLLISTGALVNVQNKSGETPLMIITRTFYRENCEGTIDCVSTLDCARILIHSGADPNTQNPSDGRTALHMALEYNTNDIPDFIKLLINAGADVNILDKNGDSALSVAMKKYKKTKNAELINMLIGAGARVDVKAKNGQTPLTHLLLGMNMRGNDIAVIENLVKEMIAVSHRSFVIDTSAGNQIDYSKYYDENLSGENIWNKIKPDYCSFANTYFRLLLSSEEKVKYTDYTNCNENEGLTDANVSSLIAFTSDRVQILFSKHADGALAKKIKSLKIVAELILKKL